ncbi:MAG TPA: phosphatase PAP2 family protein [Bryobacteraceae bacterium]|nr:phosphatase PAP2 family protein [Bryobacteraceae bacterium]
MPNDRSVSLREMIPNVVDDQRRIWTFPAHITHHHNWIPVVAVLGVTASLVATDGLTGKPFATTDTFHGFNSVFNSSATTAGILAAPAALYTVGLLRHDSYASHTALLAAEALADSEVVVTALKTATRRERPEYFSKTGNFSDSFFENPGGYGLGHGGFPSGHAIAAFSVATVVSRRYGKTHRWVPYAAYGVATAIGFSRVTSLAHFPSDVFFGAALGYSVGRFAVLR